MAYLCTITKAGAIKYQFVTQGDLGNAGYLAGMVMDKLCDYHGGDDWWYECTEMVVVGDDWRDFTHKEMIEDALSKVVV